MGIEEREVSVVQARGHLGSENLEGILQDELRLFLDRLKKKIQIKVSPGQILASRADEGGLRAALFVSNASEPVLTGSQRKVAALVGHGLGNKGIARKLGRSPNTIANHIKAIKGKLHTTSRAGIARYAVIFLEEDMAIFG
jgi:DNA-binding NarL/FixJ family response regulator